MPKLLYCLIITAAAAMLACTSPTPTPDPTAIAVADSGVIAPINADNPQAFLSTLPAAEQDCLAANSDPMRVITLAGLPGAEIASPQEIADVIDCLGDDTLLRVFLSEILADVGPLRRDSSDCIRAGFANLDLRPVLMAGDFASGPGYNLLEQAALFGNLRPYLLALSCLDRGEWFDGLRYFSMPDENWTILKCVKNIIGGPAALAAALQPLDGPIPRAFMNVESECLLLPTPQPDTTGEITLIDKETPQAFLSSLPAAEQSCLSAYPDPMRVMTLKEIASPNEAAQMIACLSDDTLIRISLGRIIPDIGPLSRESSACIRAGFSMFDLRMEMLDSREDKMSHRESSISWAADFLLPLCLNDAERQAAFPYGHSTSGLTLAEWQCVMDKLSDLARKIALELSPSYYTALVECRE